jgi:Ca-activated chloride channel family protein
VLTGITVGINGLDAYDVEPESIPDLFASRPIVMFGKWRGNPTGTIEISGNTGRGAYHASVPVAASQLHDSHAALRYLWARTRIAELSDFGPAEPSAERIEEITSLGLAYNLLTRYTSFVAVQEVVRRTTDDAANVDQPLPLPAGVADSAIGVTSGPEPELLIMATILALIAALQRRRTRQRRAGVAA